MSLKISRKLTAVGVTAVGVILAVGISIYNNAENRISRLLDLGYKYLTEETMRRRR